ncbi:DUF2795 domain-containing protein [Cupriavidus plantarum]|uniref:Uncharacterized protein DUF2795 n=1 Tax=Cupriavidus plantarum TaxID=942865 RepID=A0A316EN93_9BURK|nr:DUF2795 domain-containing protein [Cupriavidus plantarum]NYI01817.1 hypothetical protein [Cupriavidus plantarum]PWK33951.1 uncharacterized protein DUF2795 [Cupriavidus plantarum]REE91129.1 uncharacterized protein DUF2795 [Cupriavidus plantarum]RLK33801.1 uncharacterized protein DUF2795 [Cupriavidus plantarum]CAG2147588.1 hypothetical protein LMG26296_04153 [Cupriavidus plantarum]
MADKQQQDGGSGKEGKLNPIELQKALKGMDYPANRDALVSLAQKNGAKDDIIEALGRIPDRDYEDPAQVSEAVAHH